jgi:hypothetical protein
MLQGSRQRDDTARPWHERKSIAMEPKTPRSRSWHRTVQEIVAIFCVILLVPGEGVVLVQAATQAQQSSPTPEKTPKESTAKETTPKEGTAKESAAPDSAAAAVEAKIPPEQLESLVAPIALYPDDLLAQTLVASTYPLEIVQLQQWLAKHPELKDKALADAVAKQPWDPSIQSMAAVPELVKRLGNDIQWTTDLGNAFLAQQADVMDAVQRMRKKAQDKGALESNEQQKVETKVIEEKTIIVVESANPEVVYVPSYSPTVVYGASPYYPYPPIYYPPYYAGAAFVSFGIGMMWGAAMWGGACCGCGWHGGSVNVNVHNNFNQINHNVNRGGAGGGNWQHNPQHRGGAPYGNRATQNKYGGGSRGASASNRMGGKGQAGVSNRAAGGAGSAGVSNRAGGGSRSPSASTRPAGGSSSRGGNQIGNRSMPKSSSSRSSGFSGGSRGYSGSSARSSSSRGSSSMGSRGGYGGGSRGGGSRGGGGGRGGGGRR